MKKIYTCAILVLSISIGAFSQQSERCGHVRFMADMEQKHPGYSEYRKQLDEQIARVAREGVQREDGEIYRIPVVFHVVYRNDEQNVPDEKLFEQIDILNRDYGRLNEDTVNTRQEFLPVAASTGIEFYLAQWDPEGNPTNGITRTETSTNSFWLSMTDMKSTADGGKDAWDVNQYLNIWVCNMAIPILNTPFILGFATPPNGAPNWPDGSGAEQPQYDGVVLHYEVVGSIDNPDQTFASISKGRTATHEVGHYLGLRHIWGDGDCTQDDGLSDTPEAAEAQQQTCDYTSNTCQDATNDLPDQIENYMDYTDENCMNMFTQQQTAAMRYVVENFRAGLLLSSSTAGNEIEKIRIYPNPTNGLLHVKLEKQHDSNSFSVYSADGRKIMDVLSNESSVDVSNLLPGIYFLKVNQSSTIQFSKFIKH